MKRLTLLFALGLLACGSSEASSEEPRHSARADRPHEHPHHGHQPGHHHSFADVERFSRIFDDPERDAWQRPADVVAMLELEPGMTVADLGAGTGYFMPHLAEAVGADGRVLALDTEPNMVEHMRGRAEEAGLSQVEPREVATDDPGLEPSSVDRILVVDTWHHIADRPAYAALLARALRPGGFVLVVDYTRDAPEGPPAAMRLPPETVVEELGSVLDAELLEEELPRQYVVRGRAR